METIKFIGILCATWLFVVGAKPIAFIKDQLKLGNLDEPKPIIMKAIRSLINCSMCSGFWIGLAYYQDFLMACIVSIAAEIFARMINLIFKLL